MYKILVADDEPGAVESVAQMLDRNFGADVTVCSCFSGREAIEQSAKVHPDIVITDIRMFGINGFEVIRSIKGISPDTEFVILSACDYFEYAQEAISLGVAEYLVKPVDEGKLSAAIQKIINRIDNRHLERQLYLRQHEQLMMSIPLLEASFCHALAAPGDHTDHLKSIYSLIAPEEAGGYVMLLHPNWDDLSEEERNSAYEDYRYHIKRNRHCIVAMQKNTVVAYVICTEGRKADRESTESIVTRFASIQRKRNPIFIGVGQHYNQVSDAQKSYIEARCALKVLLRKANKESAVLRFENSAEAQWLYLVSQRSEVSAIFSEDADNYPDRIVQKAEDYIARHYMEPIKLEQVAQAVNLSKYYFSRFFKRKKGMSFTEYVTQVRVDCAKELLASTQLSVKEIAYQSGFRDPNYFSKLFKRITGVNPSEFRNPGA